MYRATGKKLSNLLQNTIPHLNIKYSVVLKIRILNNSVCVFSDRFHARPASARAVNLQIIQNMETRRMIDDDDVYTASQGKNAVSVYLSSRQLLLFGLAEQYTQFLANTRRWTNADLMLVHRRRRWPSFKSALVQRLLFAGINVAGARRSPGTEGRARLD